LTLNTCANFILVLLWSHNVKLYHFHYRDVIIADLSLEIIEMTSVRSRLDIIQISDWEKIDIRVNHQYLVFEMTLLLQSRISIWLELSDFSDEDLGEEEDMEVMELVQHNLCLKNIMRRITLYHLKSMMWKKDWNKIFRFYEKNIIKTRSITT
jgi:hypothetical protein